MLGKHTNALIKETSPYLQQHAHNPVNWFPWGEQALELAKREDKLIVLSIGYSACHWCHVMERESFEDEEIAAIMNTHFVNIKVDREERPDIDHIYMDAVQTITGSGGWPLNVFLTPTAKPFFGGTYFPPRRAFNRPSWKELLMGIADAWQTRRAELEEQANKLTEHISNSGRLAISAPISMEEKECDGTVELLQTLMRSADTTHGGFGSAPKFPQTFSIRLLLQGYAETGYQPALDHALLSLDRLLFGGIYDHVGGGLARYSTDHEWLAPHFEKMLYDNSLLILALCDAWLLSRNERYKDAVYHISQFLQEKLRHPEGGFYSALDADSDGEEGKYYVWDYNEVAELLTEDAALFSRFYDVTPEGNWEGKNILRKTQTEEAFAKDQGMDSLELKASLTKGLQLLKSARATRVPPELDDKVQLGWNALAIEALARAAAVFREPVFGKMATDAFIHLEQLLREGPDSLAWKHCGKDGKATIHAFLDDYASLIAACIAIYEWKFDPSWLSRARELTEYVIREFGDEANLLFYYTPKGQKDVIFRKQEVYDGATPSGNSVMSLVLCKLGVLFGNEAWIRRSEDMLLRMRDVVLKYPGSFGVWAALLIQRWKGSNEIAIIGLEAKETAHNIISGHYISSGIFMAAPDSDSRFPLLKGRPAGNPAIIYRCRNQVCDLPFTDPGVFSLH